MNIGSINREKFDKIVDDSNMDTNSLFRASLQLLQEKMGTEVYTQTIIEYAQIRYELWEFPKVIYYCYFALLEIMQDISKNQDTVTLLKIIRDSLETMISQWVKIDHTIPIHSVRRDHEKIETIRNSETLIKVIQWVKIDTITLMSYAARKMSSMDKINEWMTIETLNNFHSFYNNWDHKRALHEIYFLFSNFFLKEDIAYRGDILLIFKNFCDDWLSKIEIK